MAKLSVWHDGDSEWVVAESAEDADKVLEEHLGSNHGVEAEWDALADDSSKGIHMDADDARRLGFEVTDAQVEAVEDVVVVRTCAEWCGIFGRGHLCSTEY